MSTYKKFFIFIIVCTFFMVIIVYMKTTFLYQPVAATSDKYDKFYHKLQQLAETTNNVVNFAVKTQDDILLDTIYIKNPDTDKCIIIFHGNAGNIAMRFDMIKFLYNYGSIIIFDYRSFGKSTGHIFQLTDHSLQVDAEAIWNFAIQMLKINPNNISLLGESLGCAIAIGLAARLSKTLDNTQYPHSLILNSPFYSLSSMIEVIFSKINIGFMGNFLAIFIGHEYKCDQLIKYLNCKTKIIIAHSPRDEIIPYHEGLKLYESIRNTHKNIQFINITGTHNNLGLTDHYIYALADLFNE